MSRTTIKNLGLADLEISNIQLIGTDAPAFDFDHVVTNIDWSEIDTSTFFENSVNAQITSEGYLSTRTYSSVGNTTFGLEIPKTSVKFEFEVHEIIGDSPSFKILDQSDNVLVNFGALSLGSNSFIFSNDTFVSNIKAKISFGINDGITIGDMTVSVEKTYPKTLKELVEIPITVKSSQDGSLGNLSSQIEISSNDPDSPHMIDVKQYKIGETFMYHNPDLDDVSVGDDAIGWDGDVDHFLYSDEDHFDDMNLCFRTEYVGLTAGIYKKCDINFNDFICCFSEVFTNVDGATLDILKLSKTSTNCEGLYSSSHDEICVRFVNDVVKLKVSDQIFERTCLNQQHIMMFYKLWKDASTWKVDWRVWNFETNDIIVDETITVGDDTTHPLFSNGDDVYVSIAKNTSNNYIGRTLVGK
jgi:hypothetical protein